MISWIAIITTYVVVLNVCYAALQVWLLRRCSPAPRLLVFAIWAWAVLMSVLLVLQGFQPPAWKSFSRDWLYLPFAVEMVWNIFLPLLIFPATFLLVLVLRLRHPARSPAPEPVAPPSGLSRRKFIYLVTCGTAPVTALGMGVHGALTRDALRVQPYTVPIPGLPPELEGFTIAHVSDLHSGIFVGPERLKIVSDAANDLKADLVAVTGDLINREMDEFPAALAAIQNMESRYGTYLCEGNHDVFPGPGVVAEACASNNLPMLSFACVTLPMRRRRLLLAGLPWMGHEFPAKPEMVSNLFPARQEGDVRILLAHHPHLFDIAGSADLVLSGHTHGGQIMFGDIGLGRLRFKYCSGLFQRDNTSLLVSNGCGDWFPCRIGAPAEIGLVRLTAAKTA